MPVEYRFTCPLPNGVHARPASALEELTSRFQSSITLVNERNGRSGNTRSVLSLVGADFQLNDPCRLVIDGPDEQTAQAILVAFLRDEFPRCDEALPPVEILAGDIQLPPGLRDSGISRYRATPVTSGIGIGRVVELAALSSSETLTILSSADPAQEQARLDQGLNVLLAALDIQLSQPNLGAASEIVKAHRAVARDPGFREKLIAGAAEGLSAAGAIAAAQEHFTKILQATGSALLHERILDIQDVCHQLFCQIYRDSVHPVEVHLMEDSICLAEALTPSQFLALDRRFLKGLVLRQAGTTSHTVILARSFGVPTLTGAVGLAGHSLAGQKAVVDAELGLFITKLDEAAWRYYTTEQRRLERKQTWLQQFVSRPGVTNDAHLLEIAANITTAEEVIPAINAGAEGIGLFRTEMMFVGRDSPPSEEEQFDQFRRATADANGKPVIIRTLDAGGDKPIPYLKVPGEANPFLGLRAVRLYPEFQQLFRTQVRALVRASAFGKIKMLVPMISCLEEVRWVKQVLAEEKARCDQDGLSYDWSIPLGIMVEVPAVAFALDHLCREVDFFSLGTNDLLQYFMAADRANPRVTRLADPLNPAFLRLLDKVITEIHAHGKWVGLCGEMASQDRYLPLLTALGLDEISVATPAVGKIKAELVKLTFGVCRDLLAAALKCSTAQSVGELLDHAGNGSPSPLISEEFIQFDSESRTKAEAIKEIVDNFFVYGRTEHPRDIESAIWQREEVYSTGLGYGVGVPHCKSDRMRANTMGLLKLRQPVEWNSLDGQPIRLVILLAIQESSPSGTHLQIFSRLARQLMHEDFRRQLFELDEPARILAFLQKSLELEDDPALQLDHP